MTDPREMQIIILGHDPEPEQPHIPLKTYHGQPRSPSETRRAQRRGGKR